MKNDRKIAMVVHQVKMEDEDHLDVLFWLNKSVAERLAEVCRLRRNYYTWSEGSFPDKMEKVIYQKKI
ncbi:hypothetical protein [Pedobacter immunditicola]|uniref:hypothetical protein n=1 Tax=Pedobacter immunditicola TaxID=3133440 RepID=UPI00309AD167